MSEANLTADDDEDFRRLFESVNRDKQEASRAWERGSDAKVRWADGVVAGTWPDIARCREPFIGETLGVYWLALAHLNALCNYWGAYLNEAIKVYLDGRDEDYETKKALAKEVNERLRASPQPPMKGFKTLPIDLSILDNGSGQKCSLVVVGSEDGAGRYLLQSRATKKRFRASRSITELMPLHVVAAWFDSPWQDETEQQ